MACRVKIYLFILLGALPLVSPQIHTLSDFKPETLKMHNKYREIHHVPPLTTSHYLTKIAQAWARVIGTKNTLLHPVYKRSYRFNLAKTALPLNPLATIEAWYRERSLYNYAKGVFSYRYHHFTKMVWRSSKYIGIGLTRKGDLIFIVVAYEPGGNIDGEYRKNVFSPHETYVVKDVRASPHNETILEKEHQLNMNETLALLKDFADVRQLLYA
ncbi:Golgi-associated plant pathogenesis-related protein 1-like [Scaptodrosophila lebanonensis]|uniref:Golgi-associated plant pathogenesis-related protein 1-like n=1 Tax=Drosophila lebanonensis TaxID=7225 RepID=A0A6J2U5E1_DROLE|nr:Golgi-associated plant pathogenesis-related protein 1-like [Scaptodrosophila lebanonensis]